MKTSVRLIDQFRGEGCCYIEGHTGSLFIQITACANRGDRYYCTAVSVLKLGWPTQQEAKQHPNENATILKMEQFPYVVYVCVYNVYVNNKKHSSFRQNND